MNITYSTSMNNRTRAVPVRFKDAPSAPRTPHARVGIM